MPNAVEATSWQSLLKWLQSVDVSKGSQQRLTRLVWLEQKSEFQDYYKSFVAELGYASDNVVVGNRIAMLVRWDRESKNLVYRQLALIPLQAGGFADTFQVTEPNPHDVLVILAEIRSKVSGEPITDNVDVYNLGLDASK